MRLLPLPGTLLLALLVGWLGWRAGETDYVAPSFPDIGIVGVENGEPETVPDGPTRVKQSEAYYSAITERPLFEPSRRPLAEPEPEPEPVREAAPAPEPAPVPVFGLHGVRIQEGRDAALISVDRQPPVWVERNQLINDWILGDITTDSVELHKGPQRLGVQLHEGE